MEASCLCRVSLVLKQSLPHYADKEESGRVGGGDCSGSDSMWAQGRSGSGSGYRSTAEPRAIVLLEQQQEDMKSL